MTVTTEHEQYSSIGFTYSTEDGYVIIEIFGIFVPRTSEEQEEIKAKMRRTQELHDVLELYTEMDDRLLHYFASDLRP